MLLVDRERTFWAGRELSGLGGPGWGWRLGERAWVPARGGVRGVSGRGNCIAKVWGRCEPGNGAGDGTGGLARSFYGARSARLAGLDLLCKGEGWQDDVGSTVASSRVRWVLGGGWVLWL